MICSSDRMAFSIKAKDTYRVLEQSRAIAQLANINKFGWTSIYVKDFNQQPDGNVCSKNYIIQLCANGSWKVE